jgi:hypothetical protein
MPAEIKMQMTGNQSSSSHHGTDKKKWTMIIVIKLLCCNCNARSYEVLMQTLDMIYGGVGGDIRQ